MADRLSADGVEEKLSDHWGVRARYNLGRRDAAGCGPDREVGPKLSRLQEEDWEIFRTDVDAAVELTAYTGIAAFNTGFGATTCCSSFSISGCGAWKKEVKGDAARRSEQQWRSVVLLIVGEISSIGISIFARMHFPL